MWWKVALSAVGGFAFGIAVMVIANHWFASQIRDVRAQFIPAQWSSAGKEWPAFDDWLRHGGRKLVMDAAFSAAKDGLSETEVREVFGPPDLVVVGDDEFEAYSTAHMKGLGRVHIFTRSARSLPLQGKSSLRSSQLFSIPPGGPYTGWASARVPGISWLTSARTHAASAG